MISSAFSSRRNVARDAVRPTGKPGSERRIHASKEAEKDDEASWKP
jgi:hypothetical protein